MDLSNQNTGEVVLYQLDETIRLEVRVKYETVWLTQAQMVQLFQRDVSVISRHISNIFKEGELDKQSNLHFLQIPFSDKPVVNYSLDVIISVGYRVKSERGTQFRIWARGVLKEYLLKGFAINQRIERVENLAIETKQEVAEIKIKLEFLAQYVEGILADNNDINEDTRTQLELINQTLAKLQSNQILLDKPRNRIGFYPSEV